VLFLLSPAVLNFAIEMSKKEIELKKDLTKLFTLLIFCLFIVPFFQLFGILFQYRISLIYKYLWVMLFALSHLTNTFFFAKYNDTPELSYVESVVVIVLMILNPYNFI
jgi:hypothetical protein